jgi:hypothetical protein
MEIVQQHIHPLTEQRPLTEDERGILWRIVNRKLRFLLSTYVVLATILFFLWFFGRKGISGSRWGRPRIPLTEEQVSRFALLAPYLAGFFFILLTIYFYRHYRKLTYPYIKDVREGVKTVMFFVPERYKTPYFDAYYLKTAFRKKSMIRISKQLYDSIGPESFASIAYTPHAKFVFAIECENVKMNFNEKNSIIEM